MKGIDSISEKSVQYLSEIKGRLTDIEGSKIAARVLALAEGQDRWREKCLNLNPAETLLSRRARAVLATDMATRLTEGVPGDKLYPHGRQNDAIDEIEATIISLAQEQFGARYVEWRPVSTTMANAAMFFATLESGDLMLAQDEDGGGNYAYHRHGPAGLMNVEIEAIPRSGDCFEIDIQELEKKVTLLRPKVIAIGGSNVLFPYPLGDIRKIADAVGAKVLYDAAHLGLFISEGKFQRPLEEGAHATTISTAKSLGGPVGGALFTNDAELANKIIGLTFPGLLQTRDLNKLCAFCIALAENRSFGKRRAVQTVANAKALAQALMQGGFQVLGAERGFTETHQIFLSLGDNAKLFETRCNDANILLTDCALSGDMAKHRRTGARLSTHEISKIGMDESHMTVIADMIARAFRGEDGVKLSNEVGDFMRQFPSILYSFDAMDIG